MDTQLQDLVTLAEILDGSRPTCQVCQDMPVATGRKKYCHGCAEKAYMQSVHRANKARYARLKQRHLCPGAHPGNRPRVDDGVWCRTCREYQRRWREAHR